MAEALVADMTLTEAEACCDRIKNHLGNVREGILDLHRRRGWLALGYADLPTCVEARFGQSERETYRELAAAKIELRICPIGQPGWLPESHARELAKAPDELQALIHSVATSHGPTTAAAIADLVRQLPEQLAGKIQEQDQLAQSRASTDPDDARPLNVLRRLTNFERFMNGLESKRHALIQRFGAARWAFLISEINDLEKTEREMVPG